MPLCSTRTAMTLVETTPWAVALSMQVDGSDPPAFVRVLATLECIVSLDPAGAVDRDNALDVAEGDRMRIEAAASTKYDAEGEDPVSGELILGARDLP